MMRFRTACALGALAAAGLLAPAAWADPDGAALYTKHCASCHGADGRGGTPAGKALQVKDLASARWASATAVPEIEKAVRDGVPRMPPLASKLTADEISAVARHTRQMAADGLKP